MSRTQNVACDENVLTSNVKQSLNLIYTNIRLNSDAQVKFKTISPRSQPALSS